MFTTYRSAEIHLDTAEGTTTQLWSYVEQEISWVVVPSAVSKWISALR